MLGAGKRLHQLGSPPSHKPQSPLTFILSHCLTAPFACAHCGVVTSRRGNRFPNRLPRWQPMSPLCWEWQPARPGQLAHPCAVHAVYDPESHRTRQRGAVDNPWLMFRGFRLLLLSHGWESPPSITQHEQVRVMDDTAVFSTRIPVLLHVGSSFLAHSRRERWDTLLHSRESQQHWSSSSTICSVPQGFLAQKEPPDCD